MIYKIIVKKPNEEAYIYAKGDYEKIYGIIINTFKKLSLIKYKDELNSDYIQVLINLLTNQFNSKFIYHKFDYIIKISFKDTYISDNIINLEICNIKNIKDYKEKKFYIDYPINNCVDKFTIIEAKRLNSLLTKCIENLYLSRIDRNKQIKELGNYHNTLQYEKDFKNLIEIKNISNELYNKTKDFLENLTYIKYTE